MGGKIGAFQRVTKDRLELVKCYTGAVGIAGTHARTYYVEVTNADVSTIILFQINSQIDYSESPCWGWISCRRRND